MASPTNSAADHQPTGYWQLSRRPLQALIFLTPLILLYEAGTLRYVQRGADGTVQHILAHSMLRRFFEAIGVGDHAFYLPGLIVVAVLLGMHIAHRDPWRLRPRIYGWMGIESLVLSLPLFVFMLVGWGQPVQQWALQAAPTTTGPATDVPWQTLLVYSLGAGIYEELLFRVIAIALIDLILVDALGLSEAIGAAAAVGGSAILFAAYHFGAGNPFDLGKCLFYILAGIYFAAIYLVRGFGIVAGTHAIYDILVVLVQLLHSPNVH